MACGRFDCRNNLTLLKTSIRPGAENIPIQFVVFVEHLAAVPRQTLGRFIGSADADRYAIVAAIDLLFTGI
jgi:hypothetical protein